MKTHCVRIFLYYILTTFIFFSYVVVNAGDSGETPAWTTTPLDSLGGVLGECLEVPQFSSFNTSFKTLDLSSSGTWVSTGNRVKGNKLMKFDWSTLGAETTPRKYLIMYRIDPRFNVPQLFIQTYDYNLKKYVSDFHQFRSGQLLRYYTNPDMTFSQRIIDYNNYFNFLGGRAGIQVSSGDVINITLAQSSDFFTSEGEFLSEFDSSVSQPTVVYTVVSGADNKIIYSGGTAWCSAISASSVYSSAVCTNNLYKANGNLTAILSGKPFEPKFIDISSKLSSCAAGSNTKDLTDLCFYDKGRGMKIIVGTQTIKATQDPFMHSDFTNRDFFYYKSTNSGVLKLTTDWQISGMFSNFNQFMNSWATAGYTSLDTLMTGINSSTIDLSAKYVHFGRYIMTAEIGSGAQNVSASEQSAIKVEYIISDTEPSANTSGIAVDKTFSTNAPSDGYLWLRVINPNSNVQGTITVNYANYIGNSTFSTVVNNLLITPLREEFSNLSMLVYTKLATNATLQRIGKLMLTLYIAIYGLFFLAGATKITTTDLVTRVIKIAIIIALFSEQSWKFFNENLFVIFVQGTDYLMTSIVGASSSTGNVFGFVDPIFDRYTNGRIWALLFIQLLQIHNGLAFFAIMTIYSIILFFRAVLEVIIGYCLAFIGLCVMIALAPFFITLMLFEHTKGIFDNWLSTLFDYAIQPTILLVFFLLIDQIIGAQLIGTVSRACWGCLIPLEFAFDLRHIGIDLDFSFTLPFLPCIPFFTTVMRQPQDAADLLNNNSSFISLFTSTLLFYSYALMSNGLVEYVTQVAAQLTNVTPARQEGARQQKGDATASVISDIKSITVDPVKSAAGVFKDKVIDQNYRARNSQGQHEQPEDKRYDAPPLSKKGDDGDKKHNTDEDKKKGDNGK